MLRALRSTPDGATESIADISVERLRNVLADERSLLWVDIENLEDREIELLLEVFELHPLTVEACLLPNARPKLEEFERYLFVVLQGVRRAEKKLESVELDVCLGTNFLITVRSEPLSCIDENIARVEKRSPIARRGADFLFYAIADSLIESYVPILDEIESGVDELQTRLLADSTPVLLRALLSVYNELILLRRALTPQRDILGRLNRGDLALITPNNALYFRDLSDHLLRLGDLVDTCREVTTMSLEAYATIVSNRLNEIMKTMTAFATLSLPLVIVTGVYGMNFHEHPELGPIWIYHVLSLALLGSFPVMLYFFRKHQWL